MNRRAVFRKLEDGNIYLVYPPSTYYTPWKFFSGEKHHCNEDYYMPLSLWGIIEAKNGVSEAEEVPSKRGGAHFLNSL